MLLALVFMSLMCPTFNKLLFTLTDGTYFLDRTILYVAVRLIAALTISFFVPPLAAPAPVARNEVIYQYWGICG
jgi:hypothetical protein